MNKKIIPLILITIMFAYTALAADIGYVVRDNNYVDSKITSVFDQMSLTYDIILSNNIPSTDFLQYKAIVINDNILNNADQLPVNSLAVVSLNTKHPKIWGWTFNGISSIVNSQPLDIKNVAPDNPIMLDQFSFIQVYTQCCTDSSPNNPSSGHIGIPAYYLLRSNIRNVPWTVIGSTVVNNNDAVIGAAEKGTLFLNGQTAQQRIVFFGITKTQYWTFQTEELFKNSITWVIAGSLPPEFNGPIPDISIEKNVEKLNAYNLNDYFSSPHGATLTYTHTPIPNIEITINEDGSVSLNPKKKFVGIQKVTFTAFDGVKSTDSNEVTITVLDINHKPSLTNLTDMTVAAGTLIKLKALATDIDDDPLSFTFSTPFNSNGEWQTTIADIGTKQVTVTVTDSFGLSDTKTVQITIVPKVVINEFVSNPNTGDEEWIELFNPNDIPVTLSGFKLQDGTTTKYSLSGTLPAKGFLVVSPTFTLNNDGDIIQLKSSDDSIIDKVTYGDFDDGNVNDNAPNPAKGKSAGRLPDGFDTDNDKSDFHIFDFPTKGISNSADVRPPTVNLLSPTSGAVLTTRNIDFTFSVSDNNAQQISCTLFTDISGSFAPSSTKTVGNGQTSSFNIQDIANGDYKWNVKCSDGNNEAFAQEDFTFAMDAPFAPVLQPISDITANENDLITVTAIASDQTPEDTIIYSISDSRFTQIGPGIFQWQTDFSSSGVHIVTLTAEDTEGLSDSETFKVTVNNINRAPVFNGPIQDVIIDEDTTTQISLSTYFNDLDNDALTFTSISPVTAIISISSSGLATINPAQDFNGIVKIKFKASDGPSSVESNEITLTINPVNDAPKLLTNIPDVSWPQDTSLTNSIDLNTYFIDVDSSLITYTVSGNNRITVTISPEGKVSFSPIGHFNGQETITFTASDSLLSTNSNPVNLIVTRQNIAPVIDPILDQTMPEDATIGPEVTLAALDEDGTISKFEVASQDESKVKCIISDKRLTFIPGKDFNGLATCDIQVVDNENAAALTTVKINVTPVNDAPEIKDYSPKRDPKITENGKQSFSVDVNDIDSPEADILVRWTVDENFAALGKTFTFNSPGEGTYKIKVTVSDGEFTVFREWKLISSRIPIADSFDGNTTDFSNLTEDQLKNMSCLILEKTQYGKIDFCGKAVIDMRDVVDLDSFVTISKGLIGIDTIELPAFKGKAAQLSMYNLESSKTPLIFFNDPYTLDLSKITTTCPGDRCKNINFNPSTKKLVFDLTKFSIYKASDQTQLTCSQQNGFACSSQDQCSGNLLPSSDSAFCCSAKCSLGNETSLDRCEVGVKGNLEITIKEPDANDDFAPGETIPLNIKIKNNNNEKKDLIVQATLFDETEDDELDKVESDEINVRKSDSEDVELPLKVPSFDLDEDNDYIIFVKVFENSDEDLQCNEDITSIDIKLKKHNVVINRFDLAPLDVQCGDVVSAIADVHNIGTSDENDIQVILSNKDLDLLAKTDIFELQRIGDDDSKSLERFTFKLPDKIKGTFLIDATVFSGGNEDTVTKELRIDCNIPYIDLALLQETLDAKPGSSITVPVSIANTGTDPITISLESDPLASWLSKDAVLIELQPSETTTTSLTIHIADEAPAGTYPLSIKTKLNGATIAQQTQTINIAPSDTKYVPVYSEGSKKTKSGSLKLSRIPTIIPSANSPIAVIFLIIANILLLILIIVILRRLMK
ncbi:MAG TPA: putative S-layer protein [Candidatus Nanoarchaeia archaeon]|nr:putative S-layer protein [Candidatus Nanoarchaeia archaeon]